MRSVKVILIGCLSVFIIGNAFAQGDKSLKCSSREVKVCLDTIIGKIEYEKLQHDTADLKKQVANLSAQLEECESEIGKFLTIQDTTIFSSKFLPMEVQSISALYRDYYSLIENIHDLNVLLNSKSEGNDVERIRNLQKNVEKARQKIIAISAFATDEKRRVFDFLSPEQKQFWQQLKVRYNEMVEIFNSNSNESQ
ncbi:MAG: hypothetical protein LBJ67_08005 [Planctomycetaceae bacterium]|jgi:hypothetical protein|nr:hypothetical protein [Planctomycetaceae bacterium]